MYWFKDSKFNQNYSIPVNQYIITIYIPIIRDDVGKLLLLSSLHGIIRRRVIKSRKLFHFSQTFNRRNGLCIHFHSHQTVRYIVLRLNLWEIGNFCGDVIHLLFGIEYHREWSWVPKVRAFLFSYSIYIQFISYNIAKKIHDMNVKFIVSLHFPIRYTFLVILFPWHLLSSILFYFI